MEGEVLIQVPQQEEEEAINVSQLPLIRAFCYVLVVLALCGLMMLVSVTVARTADEQFGDIWVKCNCTVIQTAGNWTVCSAVFDCHTTGLGLLKYPSTSWFFCEYVEKGSAWQFVVNRGDHRMLWPDDYTPIAIDNEFKFVQGLMVEFILISIFWGVFMGKC